ncbi:hypothetical protein HZ326_25673 [Fusarium oxysporum f. sp. albedinis]|nr:hypothetical protein HZ326_25673 [Fusarium oxysporum f. sp. albedinis]
MSMLRVLSKELLTLRLVSAAYALKHHRSESRMNAQPRISAGCNRLAGTDLQLANAHLPLASAFHTERQEHQGSCTGTRDVFSRPLRMQGTQCRFENGK